MSLLLVEGKLDDEVLSALLWDLPTGLTIEQGGSKNSLRPKCRDRRAATQSVKACYVRDRDFDFDPPEDTSRPTIDSAIGWRWSRHEMESYLLEPEILAAVVRRSTDDAEAALLTAAGKIVHYTAARWAAGIARRNLPPLKELPTRPAEKPEFWVPEASARTGEAARKWAHRHVKEFREQMEPALAVTAVEDSLNSKTEQLAALRRADEVLVWHSGKDLLAALDPDFYRSIADNPAVLRRQLARWIREHAEQTLELVPEWRALLGFLASPEAA